MKNHSKHGKSFVIICCLAILFFVISAVLFFRGGYPQKILARFSPSEQIEFHATFNDKALDAWNNCLNQLHEKADIVFFGDSITRRGSFDSILPDKKICNLGLGSDTLVGMAERVNMIESVSPDKVFIMGGINSLRDNTLEQSVSEYEDLLKQISDKNFQQVFVISVLPISKEKSDSLGIAPKTVMSFNSSVETLSEEYGFIYIDLYSSYVSSSGFIKQELTTDGVHLTDDAYQIWYETITPFIR